MTPIIKLVNVSKEFRINEENYIDGKIQNNKLLALQDISLGIEKGETFGIIGPNGAGKSTLLRVIAGILKPDHGKVFVDGEVLPVFDFGSLFKFELTGRQNIFYYGTLLGYKKEFIRNNIENIIEFSELGRFIDVKIKKYSMGMVSRLAFSIASISPPEIFIIDEVQTVGDRIFRQKSLNRIISLKKRGITIVYVTQSTDEIMMLADKAIYLDKGIVRKIGLPSEITMQYIEDTELKLKKDLNKSISQLRKKLTGSETNNTSDTRHPTGLFGINFFSHKENKDKNCTAIDTKLELLEKIRLLKEIYRDNCIFIEKIIKNEDPKKEDKQKLIDILKRVLSLTRLEIKYSEGKNETLYTDIIEIEKKIALLSSDNIKSIKDYRTINLIVDRLIKSKNKYLKLCLIDSLYGLRDLSRQAGISGQIEKAIINRYHSCLINDPLLNDEQKVAELHKLLFILSAFNTRLDKEYLAKKRKEFFGFLMKCGISSNKFSDEICNVTDIINWSNENYLLHIVDLVDFYSNQKISSPDLISYLTDLSKKAMTRIDEQIINLKQLMIDNENKTVNSKLEELRNYRKVMCSFILKFGNSTILNDDLIIKSVKLQNSNGDEQREFVTSGLLRIRIEYESKKIINNPVFGIAVYTDGGVLVSGPNTMYQDYEIGSISGNGFVDYVINKLPLLGGEYLISIVIHTTLSFAPLVLIDKLISFKVAEKIKQDFGLIKMDAEWHHSKLSAREQGNIIIGQAKKL